MQESAEMFLWILHDKEQNVENPAKSKFQYLIYFAI